MNLGAQLGPMSITKLSPNWACQMGPIHCPKFLLSGIGLICGKQIVLSGKLAFMWWQVLNTIRRVHELRTSTRPLRTMARPIRTVTLPIRSMSRPICTITRSIRPVTQPIRIII